ncbi:deoxyribose-phosphate aldolase [Nannocystaceae bacterium ST9]
MALPQTAEQLAAWIDHTLLKPDARAAAIDQLCAEARERRMCSVCVNPTWIARAKRALAGSEVRVCTVIGFPLGANDSQIKRVEAEHAIAAGADELDMVLAIGRLLDGELDLVERDVAGVVEAAQGRVVKVILETALLDEPRIEQACVRAVAGGAGFVKTSTGFGPGGATIEAVRRMRQTVGPAIGVKASGGIRDAATARAMIEAGATRLGTSASLAILDAWTADPAP